MFYLNYTSLPCQAEEEIVAQSSRTTEDIVARIERAIEDELAHADELTDVTLDRLIAEQLPDMSAEAVESEVAPVSVIDSVSLRSIRSFGPEQTLRLSEGLTVVYAGNGRGKTSLTDALELAVHGDTSRRIGLPNASTEVKDQDHIAHRTSTGEQDSQSPPRVRIEYQRDGTLASCEWTTFGSPAHGHPDIQILPRRLLRELVNAKRTERAAPLGIALGLSTIETWSAVATELRNRSKQLSDDVSEHLELLLDELPDEPGDSEIDSWMNDQVVHPDLFSASPPPSPWRQLSADLESAEYSATKMSPLSAELEAFLQQFVELVEPGDTCPACAIAEVPKSRINELELILARSTEAAERAEFRRTVRMRREKLEMSLASWLQATSTTLETTNRQAHKWVNARERVAQTGSS